MKITAAQIQMQSQHLYQHEQSKQESIKTWIGLERPPFEANATPATEERQGQSDRVTLSTMALRDSMQQAAQQGAAGQATALPSSEEVDAKLMAMRILLEAMTGKRITIASLEGFRQDSGATVQPPSQPTPETPQQAAPPKAGWGLEYDSRTITAEHEEMTFRAGGEVTTTDGRTMAVSLEMAMSRDFSESVDVHLRAGDAVLVDPLVINFADQPPGLTTDKISFDLNGDARTEKISFVSPGSGHLFLDRNGDGRATDGAELFGPASNSGFAELAALDSDANGWLDDNDPMFAKLQVWAKDAAGSDYFAPLKDLNIGAILLDHQATPFSLNDPQNKQLGQLTDSGLFLREDGTAGTIQEIRLAV
jgi:hypothetical protein